MVNSMEDPNMSDLAFFQDHQDRTAFVREARTGERLFGKLITLPYVAVTLVRPGTVMRVPTVAKVAGEAKSRRALEAALA